MMTALFIGLILAVLAVAAVAVSALAFIYFCPYELLDDDDVWDGVFDDFDEKEDG
jgi:hypothetical protein